MNELNWRVEDWIHRDELAEWISKPVKLFSFSLVVYINFVSLCSTPFAILLWFNKSVFVGKSVSSFFPVNPHPFFCQGGRVEDGSVTVLGQESFPTGYWGKNPSSSSLSRHSKDKPQERGWKRDENHLVRQRRPGLLQYLSLSFLLGLNIIQPYPHWLTHVLWLTLTHARYATWWQRRQVPTHNSDLTRHTTN